MTYVQGGSSHSRADSVRGGQSANACWDITSRAPQIHYKVYMASIAHHCSRAGPQSGERRAHVCMNTEAPCLSPVTGREAAPGLGPATGRKEAPGLVPRDGPQGGSRLVPPCWAARRHQTLAPCRAARRRQALAP